MSSLIFKYANGTIDTMERGPHEMLEWIFTVASFCGGIDEVTCTNDTIDFNATEIQIELCMN